MAHEPSIVKRMAQFIEKTYAETGQKPGRIVITHDQFAEFCLECGKPRHVFDHTEDYVFWGIPLIVSDPTDVTHGNETSLQTH